jgi:hypothetical protein
MAGLALALGPIAIPIAISGYIKNRESRLERECNMKMESDAAGSGGAPVAGRSRAGSISEGATVKGKHGSPIWLRLSGSSCSHMYDK